MVRAMGEKRTRAARRTVVALVWVLILGLGRSGFGAENEKEPPVVHGSSTERGDPSMSGRIDRPRVEGGGLVSTREARAAFRRHGVAAAGAEGALRALEFLGRDLAAEGHLEALLRLEPTVDGGRLTVVEGPRVHWDTLLVAGKVPEGSEPSAATRLPGPLPGRSGPEHPRGVFDPRRFESILWSWIDLWVEEGYPFAAAIVESLVVRDGGVRGGVRLEPGDRLTVEEVAFPGRTATRKEFLERWIRFRPGDFYSESAWADRRARLERTGLFLRVGEPRLVVREDGGLRVVIPVEEGLHNRLEGALGYAGATESLTGFADLELGNLFGTGRRLGVHWNRLAESQTRLRLGYREPFLGPLPVGARLFVEQEDRDSTYTLATAEFLAEVWLGGDLTAFAGVEYRRSLIGAEPSERIRRVSSVVGGTWDSRRPLRWQGGTVTAAFRSGESRISPPGGRPGRSMRLQRVDLEAERFARPLRRWVGRLGLRASGLSRQDSLPPSEAIRIGGAGTVRGYREEQFATRRYLALQLEAGPAVQGGRFYAFFDVAWWRSFQPPPRDFDLWGAGIGLSSMTAARTIRLDFALPRGGGFSDGRIHLLLETRF